MSASGAAYRPEIDGLRAVAIAAVVVFHCNAQLLPAGYLGVDIFFVISGYVITASLVARRHTDLGGFLLDFYARRIRRLVPALVVCVLVSAALISLVNPQPGAMLGLGWRALLGISNLQLYREATDYFSPATDLNIYTHTWALGVEQQFYLLFPLLLWVCGLPRGEAALRRWLLPVLLLGATASLAAFVVLQRVNQPAAFFLTPPRFWEFAVGSLLFLLLARPGWRGVLPTVPPALPLLVLLAMLGVRSSLDSSWTRALVVLATALLMGSLRPATRACRWLSWAPLVGLGLISYSLYLWHWPVLVISRWTIGIHSWTLPFQLSLSLLLALLSWRFVERPMRGAEWWGRPSTALAVGLGSVAAASAVLLLPMKVLASRLFLGDRATAMAAVNPGTAATTATGTSLSARKCLYPQPPESVLRDCRLLPKGKSRGRIVLLGDSHAARLFPLLGELHRRDGWGVVAYGAEGQPFPALPYTLRDGRDRTEWERRHAGFEQLLPQLFADLRAGDVVLVKSWLDLYLIDDDFFAGGRRDRQLQNDGWSPVDPATATTHWISRLEQLADSAASVGATVVVMGPHPVFPGALEAVPPELCLPMWFRPSLSAACPAAFSVGRQEASGRIEPLMRALRHAAASHPHLLLFEPFNHFCAADSSRCTTVKGGRILYTDNNHLSRAGSVHLYEPFTAFLSSHGL